MTEPQVNSSGPGLGVRGDAIDDAGPASAPKPDEMQAPSPRTSRKRISLSKENALLAGLFAAGMIVVYLLGLRGGPAEASASQRAAERQVDSALQQLDRMLPASTSGPSKAKQVVDTFYYEARQRQIPIEQLSGNPFVFTLPAPRAEPLRTTSTGTPLPKAQPEADGDALECVRRLSLQSVLMGTHGATAMISNNMLTEGQEIQGWTVKTILPREVILTWKDRQYVLSMPK